MRRLANGVWISEERSAGMVAALFPFPAPAAFCGGLASGSFIVTDESEDQEMTKDNDCRQVDILPDVVEVLAIGICTFSYSPDPDEPPRPHGEPCQQICDYCRAHAEYLVEALSDYQVEGES